MKKSTFLLAAALFCGTLSTFAQDEIKITKSIDDNTFEPSFKFNSDYKYYGIYLDEETQGANLKDDQYVYIGADPANGRNLYIWDGSSSFATPSGINSFFVPGEYMSFQVGEAGWSGLGYNIDATHPVDLSGITSEYTLHMALKATASDAVDFYFTDGSNREAHLVFTDDATAFEKSRVTNFQRDGEWYNIDIPMTYLEDNFGLNFTADKEYKDHNIMALLAGGNKGFTIDYDAIFFYGPKNSSSIKGVSLNGNNGVAEYYTIDGTKISKEQANAMKGIYLVKQNGATKKVVNK